MREAEVEASEDEEVLQEAADLAVVEAVEVHQAVVAVEIVEVEEVVEAVVVAEEVPEVVLESVPRLRSSLNPIKDLRVYTSLEEPMMPFVRKI